MNEISYIVESEPRPNRGSQQRLHASTSSDQLDGDAVDHKADKDIESAIPGSAAASTKPSRISFWKGRLSALSSANASSVDVVLEEMDQDTRRFNSLLDRCHPKYPRLGRALFWLRGPSPAVVEIAVRPFLPKVEGYFDRRLRWLHSWKRLITPVFLLAWLLGFTFMVRASFFTSSTNLGTPTFIDATTTYWTRDDTCGINGTSCEPFSDSSFVFRCPGQTTSVKLLNTRVVGDLELIFQPLVVGGMDPLSTYRADSWICAAAIHHGLFGASRGGCGVVDLVGEFTGYVGGEKHGVESVGFASTFPSSYRFVDTVDQGGCQDLRNDILGFNVAMTTIYSFVIRPAPQAFFWALFSFGFWHVVLSSDPSAMPPDIATGFGRFLPSLFVAKAFWRHSWRWVLPAFETAILERTIWYLGGFWVGLLMNVSLDWIPIDRLTASDIKKQPGGLVAVIVLVILVVLCVLNQLRIIRRTGWFFFYLKWYAVGGAVIGVLCLLPGLEFRLHHYIAAIALMPGCAFVTRPSALFQGFLLGMFLNGVARWGYDSILQTAAELVGDGQLGTGAPTFLTNATSFIANQSSIVWNPIPTEQQTDWNEFALLVDDVLRYRGPATNFSITALNDAIPHYFRLAFSSNGQSGDFTRAATAFIRNGTWIDPAPTY